MPIDQPSSPRGLAPGSQSAAVGRPKARRPRVFSRGVSVLVLVVVLVLGPGCRGSLVPAGAPAGVRQAKLANGLQVVVVPSALAPVAVTVMNYLVGSNEAPPGFPGMAHAQEHMMFRGSPGLSADQLADIAAAMGGSFDADTRQMVTQYFFSVPAEDLDVALRIESIRMRGVLDSQALWEKERGAIEQEVAQDLSNPVYVFTTRLLADMFQGTVYAHDALGTRASFDRTTGAMLQRFHRDWYVPNNAIFVIAGNVEPGPALDRVRDLFGDIPSRRLPARPAVRLQPVKPQSLDLKTDLPYGLAVVAFRLPGTDSPDFAAARVLADVLSSERGRLYGLVPEGQALAAGFSLSPLPVASLGYAVAAYPSGADGPALVDRLKTILDRTRREGVPADLVGAAIRKETAGREFQKNSITGLALAWSRALAIEGRGSPEDALRNIERVTPAEVDGAARQWLDLGQAVTAVLRPEASGKPVSTRSFGAPESFAPESARAVKLPEWASKALSRLEIPPSTVHPSVTRLANGLTLIIQPESISPTVSLYGAVKNQPGLETPPGQEGVDEILDGLFDYGTTSLDRLAFQKALDDIAADESAGTEFSLQVLADRFERGVELLADNLLHPALPETAFTVTQRQLAAETAGRLQSPDYLAERALEEALLPPGDPGLRRPTPASISALTLENVRDYYRRVFRPDLATIVIIGQVEPDEARAIIEKHFGAWSSQGPPPGTSLPAVPANSSASLNVPDASRVQDSVVLAETIGLDRLNPDYYALQLGNHVLGGGFYATRLYRDLREEEGLVYFVSSALEIGLKRSFYKVSYGCDPDKAAAARAVILRDLEAMRTTPASAEEIHQAKAMLLREMPLAESSLAAVALELLSRSTRGLPLDEPSIAAGRYLALDAEQVRAAMARWIRPGDLVEVIQGPRAK
jgi:zinc protease